MRRHIIFIFETTKNKDLWRYIKVLEFESVFECQIGLKFMCYRRAFFGIVSQSTSNLTKDEIKFFVSFR